MTFPNNSVISASGGINSLISYLYIEGGLNWYVLMLLL